jgi:hypothetical protein
MKNLKYGFMKKPKNLVNDYLINLSNDELQSIYNTSFSYGIKVNNWMQQMQNELLRRNINPSPSLF